MNAKGNNGKKKMKDDLVEQQVNGVLDLGLVKSDPDKLYPIIYYALKRTLKEWAESMDERPENIKRSTQGKLAAATQVQSAEYLKPLFKTLRSRVRTRIYFHNARTNLSPVTTTRCPPPNVRNRSLHAKTPIPTR